MNFLEGFRSVQNWLAVLELDCDRRGRGLTATGSPGGGLVGRTDGGRLVSVAFVGFRLRPVGSIGQGYWRRDDCRRDRWLTWPAAGMRSANVVRGIEGPAFQAFGLLEFGLKPGPKGPGWKNGWPAWAGRRLHSPCVKSSVPDWLDPVKPGV